MRCTFCLILFLIIIQISKAQVSSPYAVVNNGSSYSLAQLNPATGASSIISVVPGVSSFVLGSKHCISAHDSTYTFVGFDGNDARLYTLSIQTGTLLYNPPFNGIVVGLRYNGNDSLIYALQDTGGRLDFVSVDRQSGITTTKSLVGNGIAYVGESFVIDAKRNLYHFVGFDGPDPRLYSIDINTANIVGNPLFGDNVTALSYNCADSLIYGLWEDANQYKVEIVDPVSGTHASIGVLSGVTPGIFAETATITALGEFTYAGFDGLNSPSLISFDAQSANTIHNTNATINFSGVDQLVCCLASGGTTTDVSELFLDLGKVYPNPSTSSFVITGLSNLDSYHFQLFNMLGETIYQSISRRGIEVSVPGSLTPGPYFLLIHSASGKIGRELLIIE